MILRDTRSTRASSSLAILTAAGGALLMGLAAATPARALDDGAENIFVSIGQLLTVGVGLGGSTAKPQIEYRERPPLVLPPNLSQLPQPGSGVAARNPNWPQDFDQQRFNRAAARDRNVRDAYDDVGGRNAPRPVAGAPVAPVGGVARTCGDEGLERLCNPNEFWQTMRTNRLTEQQVAVGQEPPRRSLTDPPPGFRRATTAQTYTFEVEQRIDLTDPRAQAREEARRQQAIARGEDPNR